MRYELIMRSELISAASYLALMTLIVYGVLDRSGGDDPWFLYLAGIVVLQVGVGFVAGRWWTLGLPLLVVLISVPAVYPPTEGGDPLPLWFELAFYALFAIPLVAAGVVARKIYDWRRDSCLAA